MEKILNEDERIRKAEEIYLRRNNRNISLSQDRDTKIKRYLGSKILFNLLVLFNITVLIFCLQNKDYIFTEEFLKQCSQYNINISEKINQVIKNFLVEDTTYEHLENKAEEKDIEETNINTAKIQESNKNEITENVIENTESSSLSEMDLDVENLKKIYKFVKPLEATVSSEFGARESKYQNVTGYHTGIDLAAEKGTAIKAAMQGIVELVSSEGDYRKTCKN